MSDPRRFVDAVVAHLNQCAPITARAMFGGYGLYLNGVMMALIASNRLYFKVDEGNREDFITAGMVPFVYEARGRQMQMSYFELPDPVYQDLATLTEWIEKAYAAGQRSRLNRRKRRSSQGSGSSEW